MTPDRVRVTAPQTGMTPPGAKDEPTDITTVYVRSLIRSQLRLAIVCALGFVVLLAGHPVALALFPELEDLFVGPVPLSWLLLGFGAYPILITIAALYVRAAVRNEAGYRSLTERSRSEDA